MKRVLVIFLPFIVLLLVMNGCKSTKLPTERGKTSTKELDEFVVSMQKHEVEFNTLSAKLNVNLRLPDKSISSRVEFKLAKDSILQLSVQPLLGIEVFRIELSKDSIKAMDRMNKRYVAEGYNGLKEEFKFDFNFYNLQALFINRLFLPGHQGVDNNLYKHFKLERKNDATILNTQDNMDLSYLFRVDNEERLTSTQISEPKGIYKLIWEYSDFQPIIQSHYFPQTMEVSFTKEGLSQGDMNVSFSRIQLDRKLNMNFSIPAKYKRITFAQILKTITEKEK